MRKYIIYTICIFAVVLWGCSKATTDTQSHGTKEAHVSHDHGAEGHNHEEHDHEGEDHDHVSESGDTDHDHDHTGHSHGEGDEIIIPADRAKLMGIKAEAVTPQTFHQVIKTSGQIVSAQGEERTLVATISGVVSLRKLDANEGKAVSKGEAIFSISASRLADGDPVLKAKMAFERAKQDYERAEKLIGDKLISQKEYNEIKLTYDNAKINYDALGAGQISGGATITSPIGGYIKSRMVEEGQFVNVGDPLMVVTQNNKLQLRADVSEKSYSKLQTIRSANFKTPYSETIYKLDDMGGQIISYGKSVGNGEYFIPVNFRFNNVGDIIPGSYVEVYLLATPRENVITVAKESLIDQQGNFFVYCKLNDEEYVRREVKTGTSDGSRVEILKGLVPGEQVVSEGAYYVKLASASSAIPHGHTH